MSTDTRYLRNHILLPIALPVGSMLFLALLVFSFSRMLLASNKTGAVLIAMAAAAEVLIVGVLVALRRTQRAIHGPVIALLIAAMIVLGFGTAKLVKSTGAEGADTKDGTVESGVVGGAAAGPAALKIVSKGIQFDKSELAMPANSEVKLELDNADGGTVHNVSIYGDDSLAQTIFKGALITGPKKTTYTIKTPAAGEYYFHCDVHPNMNGTVKVA